MHPYLTISTVLTLSFAEAYGTVDAVPLTYNKNIWSLSTEDIAKKFPVYKWQQDGNDYLSSSAEDLEFMGMSIQGLSVHSAPNGTQSIELLIYSPEHNGAISNTKFSHATQVWKQLLDKNTKKVGRRMPSISSEGITDKRTAWEFDDSVAVLSAQVGDSPKQLKLTLLSKSAGTAYLQKETEQKVAGDSAVLKELKGKTSILQGRRYKKQDIEGDPEYFLLYFSASW
ncbi:hypothetical protein Rhal01_00124 [Rubritalea halochordaticola]|uniref:Uncharacterized protein n=1 Tax=Rubritalea halochordaticola TaxID=714537 RepID=A0ABP9UW82_9BACT